MRKGGARRPGHARDVAAAPMPKVSARACMDKHHKEGCKDPVCHERKLKRRIERDTARLNELRAALSVSKRTGLLPRK